MENGTNVLRYGFFDKNTFRLLQTLCAVTKRKKQILYLILCKFYLHLSRSFDIQVIDSAHMLIPKKCSPGIIIDKKKM